MGSVKNLKCTIAFLTAFIALLFFWALITTAYAASPDDAEEATTTIDNYGYSRWSYQDAYDAYLKREGGYTINGDGFYQCLNCHDSWSNFQEFIGPHGGYDTTTNKCKMCHAVHRAEGAYYLLRANSQDDACAYCHLNGAIFSRIIVYDLNPGGIYTPNGHTIGASSIIPDSSVYQWLEEVELKTTDADGNEVTATIEVRRYYERRNKMFRFARHHGQSAPADTNNRSGYGRIGPLALRCMNCHQPHNATDMIWKPYDLSNWPNTKLANGYKLLRSSPSGSIYPSTTQQVDGTITAWQVQVNRLPVWPIDGDTGIRRTLAIRVPEEPTIGPSNTGLNNWATSNSTIWTDWPETAYHEFNGAVYRDPSVITQYALSVWCADCHNLNIGYWREAEGADPMLFGFHQHADRTHPVPYAGARNGPGQCYSCHRNDMPLMSGTRDEYGLLYTRKYLYDLNNTACEQCHFGTYSYYDVKEQANEKAYERFWWAWIDIDYRYDFPHSGGQGNKSYRSYIKMLGPWTAYIDGNGSMATTQTTVTENNLDAVCKRCHPGIGVNH